MSMLNAQTASSRAPMETSCARAVSSHLFKHTSPHIQGIELLFMESLQDRLSRYRQIKLIVIGRNSGKTIAVPVWFVAESERLYLLPVHGSETRGIGTCSRARKFGSTLVALKRNSRLSPSQNPTR
jgi:hypothetical protein